MKESNVTKIFMLECSRLGGIPERCNAGMAKSFGGDGVIKLHSKGFPDYLAIMPNGITVYVELKATDGRVRDEQYKWRDLLVGLGHRHLFYRNDGDLYRHISGSV